MVHFCNKVSLIAFLFDFLHIEVVLYKSLYSSIPKPIHLAWRLVNQTSSCSERERLSRPIV
jgi:hypothetical protein